MSALNSATRDRLDDVVTASQWLSDTSPTKRASLLNQIADALAAASQTIIAVAAEETLLPLERVEGEQSRTINQLRLYAEVVLDGAWLGASITHARPDAVPPIPDHRRVNIPLGPVIVFAASNFPLAFGVAGTDTASAWAAGCAVVAKGHPGHPRLSNIIAATIRDALRLADAPDALFTLLDPSDAVDVLRDRRIAAGAFTGSTRGGAALARIAHEREVPIPFYAEMGSVNPVIVTAAAWSARRAEILDGLVQSMSLNNGQLCTSPGALFVPERRTGIAKAELAGLVERRPAGTMLTDDIADGFRAGMRELEAMPGVESAGTLEVAEGRAAHPVLWLTDVATVGGAPAVLEERFGPSSLIVRYNTEAEVLKVIAGLDGQLTATIFAEEGEDVSALARGLAARAGRILMNSWPTGVSVSWSMHHGGPWPATSAAAYGSVGAEALDRFTRPVTLQSFRDDLLPEPLRESNPWRIPRRVDGTMQLE